MLFLQFFCVIEGQFIEYMVNKIRLLLKKYWIHISEETLGPLLKRFSQKSRKWSVMTVSAKPRSYKL